MKVNLTVHGLGSLEIEVSEKLGREIFLNVSQLIVSDLKPDVVEDKYADYYGESESFKIVQQGKIQKVITNEDEPDKLMFYECRTCGRLQYTIGKEGTVSQCSKCQESVSISGTHKVEYNCDCGQYQDPYVKGTSITHIPCKNCRELVEVTYLD